MPAATQHKKWSADVKRQLFLKGMTIKGLARELGFHQNSLYRAINHGMYPRVRKAVGVKLQVLTKG